MYMDIFGIFLRFICGGYIFLASQAVPYLSTKTNKVSNASNDICMYENEQIMRNFYGLEQERRIENRKAYREIYEGVNDVSFNSTKALARSLFEIEGLDELSQNFIVCSEREKRNPNKLTRMEMKKMMRDTAMGNRPLAIFCSQKKPENEILFKRKYYKCLKSKNILYIGEESSFNWRPINHTNLNMIKNTGIVVDLDRANSNVEKILKETGSISICDPFENEQMNEEGIIPKNLVYPFSDRKYNGIDLNMMKLLMRMPNDQGYSILINVFNGCTKYQNTIENLFSINKRAKVDDIKQELDQLLVEKKLLLESLAEKKKQLEREEININIKDLSHMIENVILAELRTIKLVMCDMATNALKSTVAKQVLKQLPSNDIDNLFFSDRSDSFSLSNALVKGLEKKIEKYIEIISRISQNALSLSLKKKSLAFLSKSYYPNDEMANYLITTADVYMCQIIEGQKQIDRLLLQLKRKIQKEEIKFRTLERMANPGYHIVKLRINNEKKKILLNLFVTEQKIHFHFLRSILSVLQMMVEEQEVIKNEMTMQREYRECQKISTETKKNYFIQKDIAVEMLSSLEVRCAVFYELIDAYIKQRYMLQRMSSENFFESFSAFDILNQGNIQKAYQNSLKKAKLSISSSLPVTFISSFYSDTACKSHQPPATIPSIKQRYDELLNEINNLLENADEESN